MDMTYLVENIEEPSYNRYFLVKAVSKREAIDKVYDMYGFEEYYKKDYVATEVNDLEYDEGIHLID